jgi:hypothetical protein
MEHKGHTSCNVCSETKFTLYNFPKQGHEFKISMTNNYDESKCDEYWLPCFVVCTCNMINIFIITNTNAHDWGG